MLIIENYPAHFSTVAVFPFPSLVSVFSGTELLFVCLENISDFSAFTKVAKVSLPE